MADRTDTINNNLHVAGTVTAEAMTVPAEGVSDASVQASANIAETKVKRRVDAHFAQNGTAAADTRFIWKASKAGTISSAFAGSIVANIGDSTVTVNIKKNGTTILSSNISLTSSHTARQAVAGTLSVTTFAAGDVFEVTVTVSAGTGTLATGLFAGIVAVENGL